MTGYTSPDNLPFPDDYQQPADSPSAFAALANAVQAALDSAKTFASGLVLNSVTGTNGDKAPSQNAVRLRFEDVESRSITAGAGLSGGGTLSGSRELNVNTLAPLYVTADHVGLDTGWTDQRYAQLVGNSWNAPKRGLSVGLWNIGTLTAGQEKEAPITVPDGAFVLVSVQHHSTYIHAVANLTSGTACTLRVRNSTTQTTHTNVKVHVLIVNP